MIRSPPRFTLFPNPSLFRFKREAEPDPCILMCKVSGGYFPRLNIAMEIHSTETIKQAVVAGFGIAFLSAHTIGLDLLAGNLVVLDVQGFPALLNWYLVHNRSKGLPPVAAAFKDFLMRSEERRVGKEGRSRWA